MTKGSFLANPGLFAVIHQLGIGATCRRGLRNDAQSHYVVGGVNCWLEGFHNGVAQIAVKTNEVRQGYATTRHSDP